MEPLRPQPGSTIDPRNAVGRTLVTARARTQLRDGNNLSINDPRRMGKTVWIDLFCANPGDGLAAVKIDFEGVHTVEEFLLRTVATIEGHQSMPRQAMARLRVLFDGIEVTGPVSLKAGVSTRPPTELLEHVMQGVEEHLADDILVIAMDEVPIAMANIAQRESPEAAHHLLQTLRNLRRRGSRLRWIVCGSIGFHHVLRQCHATEGVINDLVDLPLGPLEPAEAEELARRLLLGIERAADDGAVAAMVAESGCIPFLIHQLAHRLNESGRGPVSADTVADAFQDFLDDRDGSRAVTHLVTRLDPLYGDDSDAAAKLLDRIAVDGPLAVADAGVGGTVLDDLVDDHYLIERDRTISWRYDVIKRIWKHRRRLG